MDPEFQKVVTVVVIVGTLVGGIGTLVLFLAFRSAQKERSMNPTLIGGLLIFIFACCLALFALSYAAHR